MTTINCTNCHGTIIRDFKLEASIAVPFTFEASMKCPHCQTPNRIKIVVALAKDMTINGRNFSSDAGEKKHTVRTL